MIRGILVVLISKNFGMHIIQFSRAYDTKFVGVHMIRSFRVHTIRIYPTTLILPIA